MGWDGVYAPGDLITQFDIHVEVLVYSLEQNKLVWAGQSTTTNPRGADKLVREVVKKVAAEMKKAGLISRKADRNREGGIHEEDTAFRCGQPPLPAFSSPRR